MQHKDYRYVNNLQELLQENDPLSDIRIFNHSAFKTSDLRFNFGERRTVKIFVQPLQKRAVDVFTDIRAASYLSNIISELDVIIIPQTHEKKIRFEDFNSIHTTKKHPHKSFGALSFHVNDMAFAGNEVIVSTDKYNIVMLPMEIHGVWINILGISLHAKFPDDDTKSSQLDIMENLLYQAGNNPCIMAGSINIDLNTTKPKEIPTLKTYLNYVKDNGFYITNSQEKTCPPGSITTHILTNIPHCQIVTTTALDLSLSDSNGVLFEICTDWF